MTRVRHEARRFLALIVAIGVMFVVALLMNLYVLPLNHVVSSFYAIPVLVAAHRLSPRKIGVAGAVAAALYLFNAYIEDRPLVVWPFGVLALGAVTYLAVLFAAEKEKTAQHTREVEDAHRRLQEFLGMVGHDLAGALTGVLGYAELLGQNVDDPSMVRQLRAETAIDGAAGRMRRLIDDLRDAASIGTGHFTMHRAPMDLSRVVERVVLEQQVGAGERQLLIDAPEAVKGWWDEERLGQVFTNLISNALNYSPPTGEVRVLVREHDGEAVVSVSDDGRGIPPEQQEFLFRPFYRVPSTESVKGMGLGLYIAKAVADAHGSRIRVESTPGHGTTFSVTLPLDYNPGDHGATLVEERPMGG